MEVEEVIKPDQISYRALVRCGHDPQLVLYESLRWVIVWRRHAFMEEKVV